MAKMRWNWAGRVSWRTLVFDLRGGLGYPESGIVDRMRVGGYCVCDGIVREGVLDALF